MAHAVADRLGDGLGLLVDLLEHEGLEAALLGALVVPVELRRLVLDGRAVGAPERGALGGDRDDLAVGRELDAARLAQERGRVRRQEHLVRADSDDERNPVHPHADEQPGVVVVDRDEREVALELREGEPHGLDEITLVVLLDEMRDRLGVGLGGERRARRRASRSLSSR